MSSFRNTVSSHRRECKELPLVHTTNCETLEKISSSNSLIPQYCDVFKESLVYLFYGRPAYKPKKRRPNKFDPTPLCPICLVFKPQTVSRKTHRMFPCDSGAVHCDFFTPHIAHNDLIDLELESKIQSAKRLVNLIFENNGNYLTGSVSLKTTFIKGSLEQRFTELLTKHTARFDDRRSAIEIQINHTINLKNRLLFVLLPGEFLDNGNIRNTILNIWKCEPIPYLTFKGTSPEDYYPVLKDRVVQNFVDAKRI